MLLALQMFFYSVFAHHFIIHDRYHCLCMHLGYSLASCIGLISNTFPASIYYLIYSCVFFIHSFSSSELLSCILFFLYGFSTFLAPVRIYFCMSSIFTFSSLKLLTCLLPTFFFFLLSLQSFHFFLSSSLSFSLHSISHNFFPFHLFDHLFLYLIIFLIKVINTYSFFSNAFFTSFTHFHFPFSCIPYHTLFFYLHLLSHLFLFVSLNYTFSSVTNMYSFFSYDFHFYFSYFSSLFLPSHPLPLSIDQLSVKRFLTSIPLSSSFSFVPHLIFPESISGGGKKIYSR